MLFIYSAVLLFILIIAFFKGRNMLFWSLGSYLISSSVILISLLIYNIATSLTYSLQAGILEKAGYYIVFNLKLHIADIVTLYNFGNFLLLSSSVIFLIVSDKKISFGKIMLFIPPLAYLIINHPHAKYLLWNYCMIHGYENPFESLVIANTALMLIYFVIPIAALVHSYFKTRILSKKKYALSAIVYIAVIEITMGLVMQGNVYSNYYPLRYDVNSLPLNHEIFTGILHPLFSINSKYTELFLAAAIGILIYILIYCDFSSTFNIRIPRRSRASERENNETLKIIFHTYKNAFFAIERFGSILEGNIEEKNKTVRIALENIKNISHSFYINSKKMSDSVILTYDFSNEKVRLDLSELLNNLLMQYDSMDNLSVEREFPKDKVYINGSHANLTEAFTNILNNSVEAISKSTNPTIRVSLFVEGHSAVINFFDNGCGIKKSNIKKIFKPLYSSKNSSTNFGIGLTTVLKTISYHSGTIFCKSKPNEYTVFQIILPRIK